MAPAGALKVGWLNKLKNSDRKASSLDSVTRKRLANVKSSCLRESALKIFRPAVPYRRFPGPAVRASGGRTNASVVFGKRDRQTGFAEVKNQQLTSRGINGWPTISGRWPPRPVFARSPMIVGVKGSPDCKVAMPLT